MAKTVSLNAQSRNQIGRTAVRALRSKGRIPGVLYGKGQSEAILLDGKELSGALHHAASQNLLVQLSIEHGGKKEERLALLQDVQMHPIKDTILHVDLHALNPDEKLHTEVPVVELGEPVGIKAGGVLEVTLRSLHVECLPKDLPEVIEVDVSAMEIGSIIHVGDIKLPAGVTARNPKDLAVCMVVEPKVVEETPVASTEVKQPEVLKEKKTDDAAAEAKPAGKDAKPAGKDGKK